MENEKVEVTLLSNEVTIQTETLDKLYLEWSQFTKVKTKTELNLEKVIEGLEERLGNFERAAGYINKYFEMYGTSNTSEQRAALSFMLFTSENKEPMLCDINCLEPIVADFDDDIPF